MHPTSDAKVAGVLKGQKALRAKQKKAYHSGEEPERLQVLEDVARLGGDEQHVQLLHRLVHVTHRLRLHERMLLRRRLGRRSRRRRRAHQLGECGEQALDSRLWSNELR